MCNHKNASRRRMAQHYLDLATVSIMCLVSVGELACYLFAVNVCFLRFMFFSLTIRALDFVSVSFHNYILMKLMSFYSHVRDQTFLM